MASIRRGGQARLPGGASLTWSQAEGARGTRWREASVVGDGLVRSLLLEVTSGGRPNRLELTTAAGLLTLHPERDESAMHGNVVTPSGVRHLSFPWSPDHELLVLASPASAALTLGRMASHVAVGSAIDCEVLRIDDALDPQPARWRLTRTGERDWNLAAIDGEERRTVTLDSTGRPVLPEAVDWPLEA
jgi:hypothetical protein